MSPVGYAVTRMFVKCLAFLFPIKRVKRCLNSLILILLFLNAINLVQYNILYFILIIFRLALN